MNAQQAMLQALAVLVGNLGYSIKGGKELYFSDELISQLTPDGQLQAERHPQKPGVCIRYFHNKTINVEAKAPKESKLLHEQAEKAAEDKD